MYTLQELKDAVVELYKNNTPIPKPNTSARILKVAVAKICGEKKGQFLLFDWKFIYKSCSL